ncbi:MAG: SIMPL domain-containing protein [Natronomonas sp.]
MTEPTVTTSGTGRRTAKPDIAEVQLWVEGRHDSAEVTHRKARDREAAVREALSTTDVPEDCVRTTDTRIENRESGFEFTNEDPDYRTELSLTVDCLPETAGTVVCTALDSVTGIGVENVRFDIGDAERRRLGEAALTEATETARRQAEAIAAAEERSVGEVIEVTTDHRVNRMESIVDDALASTTGDFEPTPVEVEASVKATFELEDRE